MEPSSVKFCRSWDWPLCVLYEVWLSKDGLWIQFSGFPGMGICLQLPSYPAGHYFLRSSAAGLFPTLAYLQIVVHYLSKDASPKWLLQIGCRCEVLLPGDYIGGGGLPSWGSSWPLSLGGMASLGELPGSKTAYRFRVVLHRRGYC